MQHSGTASHLNCFHFNGDNLKTLSPSIFWSVSHVWTIEPKFLWISVQWILLSAKSVWGSNLADSLTCWPHERHAYTSRTLNTWNHTLAKYFSARKPYSIAKDSLYQIHNSWIINYVINWMSTLPFGIVFSYKRRLTFSFTITAGGVVVPLELIV